MTCMILSDMLQIKSAETRVMAHHMRVTKFVINGFKGAQMSH